MNDVGLGMKTIEQLLRAHRLHQIIERREHRLMRAAISDYENDEKRRLYRNAYAHRCSVRRITLKMSGA